MHGYGGLRCKESLEIEYQVKPALLFQWQWNVLSKLP